jgi:hypothetical protein
VVLLRDVTEFMHDDVVSEMERKKPDTIVEV